MLDKVKNALLVTDNADLCNEFIALAEDIEVELKIEDDWNKRYRTDNDIVIISSEKIEDLNPEYYNKAVVMLKEGESPVPLLKMGVRRFIFNRQNRNELLFALYKEKAIVIHSTNSEYETILENTDVVNFCKGDYDFKFDKERFKYKGSNIYLTNGEKCYLAEWLLNGHKDNTKRMYPFLLRKKFGKEFLSDIDRFGRYKEKGNSEVQDSKKE